MRISVLSFFLGEAIMCYSGLAYYGVLSHPFIYQQGPGRAGVSLIRATEKLKTHQRVILRDKK